MIHKKILNTTKLGVYRSLKNELIDKGWICTSTITDDTNVKINTFDKFTNTSGALDLQIIMSPYCFHCTSSSAVSNMAPVENTLLSGFAPAFIFQMSLKSTNATGIVVGSSNTQQYSLNPVSFNGAVAQNNLNIGMWCISPDTLVDLYLYVDQNRVSIGITASDGSFGCWQYYGTLDPEKSRYPIGPEELFILGRNNLNMNSPFPFSNKIVNSLDRYPLESAHIGKNLMGDYEMTAIHIPILGPTVTSRITHEGIAGSVDDIYLFRINPITDNIRYGDIIVAGGQEFIAIPNVASINYAAANTWSAGFRCSYRPLMQNDTVFAIRIS